DQTFGGPIGVSLHVDKPWQIDELADVLAHELLIERTPDARAELRKETSFGNRTHSLDSDVDDKFIGGRKGRTRTARDLFFLLAKNRTEGIGPATARLSLGVGRQGDERRHQAHQPPQVATTTLDDLAAGCVGRSLRSGHAKSLVMSK